jgi:hypothetical protein
MAAKSVSPETIPLLSGEGDRSKASIRQTAAKASIRQTAAVVLVVALVAAVCYHAAGGAAPDPSRLPLLGEGTCDVGRCHSYAEHVGKG